MSVSISTHTDSFVSGCGTIILTTMMNLATIGMARTSPGSQPGEPSLLLSSTTTRMLPDWIALQEYCDPSLDHTLERQPVFHLTSPTSQTRVISPIRGSSHIVEEFKAVRWKSLSYRRPNSGTLPSDHRQQKYSSLRSSRLQGAK